EVAEDVRKIREFRRLCIELRVNISLRNDYISELRTPYNDGESDYLHVSRFCHKETTSAGNAPDKYLYANLTDKPSGKKVDFCTFYTPGGNEIDVVVLVVSIRAISERFVNTAYGVFLGKRLAYPVVANYVRNTLDVNLLKEDVGTIPVWVKLHGVSVTAFSEDGFWESGGRDGIHKEKEDRSSKPRLIDEGVFVNAIGHTTMNANVVSPSVVDEPVVKEKQSSLVDTCIPKEVVSPSAVDETVAKEKQSPLVNTTGLGSSSYARAMIELRADLELKDNIMAAMPKITSEGYYTCNIHVDPSTTHIVEKVDKIEKLIINGKVTLVDDKGKALEKVASSCQDIPNKLQAIFDKLDITVRGRRKK
nr:hypothetical protein [Tanacetum cinerariifolium]